ncbi:hypothetical protein [Spirillospora albida]|uniref:hypothetical protein n=1 Tax=Spirillospora albida TaxID=58123 RepID=UPI0004C0C7DF|nr:hypothetical protein [Spirillospora albida]
MKLPLGCTNVDVEAAFRAPAASITADAVYVCLVGHYNQTTHTGYQVRIRLGTDGPIQIKPEFRHTDADPPSDLAAARSPASPSTRATGTGCG